MTPFFFPEFAILDMEGLGLMVVGFLFVIVVLGILSAVTSILGTIFIHTAAQEARKAAESAEKAAQASAAAQAINPAGAKQSPTPAGEDLAPEIAAVIAAAVHFTLQDTEYRIVSIRDLGRGWAQEGRRQIFSSHRLR
jgi:Na+-transporting methylmalonyl-CoA/oxaloacetate decarboxylase gamma subunit